MSERSAIALAFERTCAASHKAFPFIAPQQAHPLSDDLMVAGLRATPAGVWAATLLTLIAGGILGAVLFALHANDLGIFAVITGLLLSFFAYTFPRFSARHAKTRAEQESLAAMLLLTTYLRATPSLEKALYFTAHHLKGALGRDLAQMMRILESGRAASVHEAAEFFMPLWSRRNPAFAKSFRILRGVQEQRSDEAKAKTATRAMDSLLNETYGAVKRYSRALQGPLVLFQVAGIALPVFGLVAFPLLGLLLEGSMRASYLAFGLILLLPALLYFYSETLISRRPGTFPAPGEEHVRTSWPEAAAVAAVIILPAAYLLANQGALSQNAFSAAAYAWPQVLPALAIVIGAAAGIAVLAGTGTMDILRARRRAEEAERGLPEALMNLSRHAGSGATLVQALRAMIEQERAGGAQPRGAYAFFADALQDMHERRTTLGDALFAREHGTLSRYPSPLLRETSWLLTERSRAGAEALQRASAAMAKNLASAEKAKELLADLPSETAAAMNVQARFVIPLIAATLGTLAFAIVRGLYVLGSRLDAVAGVPSSVPAASVLAGVLSFIASVPPAVLQASAGLGMLIAVVLLSKAASSARSGQDSLAFRSTVARNMAIAAAVFSIATLACTMALSASLT